MSGRIGFILFIIMVATLSFADIKAEDKPVVVPIAKIGDSELTAVLPNEKVLIIIVFAFQIIKTLVTYIYKEKEKKDDKTEEKLDRLFKLVHDMQAEIKALGVAPTENEILMRIRPEIELMVIKAAREYREER